MTTDAPADPTQLGDLAARAAAAFHVVHERVFAGDPAANARLTVEACEAAVVGGVPTLILVTPWAVNGLLFPPGAGPSELTIAAVPRRVIRGDVAPLGVYWSVNLVRDVSRLTSPRQARALAASYTVPFRSAVEAWLGPSTG